MPQQVYGTQLEDVEAGYLALLQEHLPAAIVAVEAYWQERGDPVALPSVKEWHRGDVPEGDTIFHIISDFPAVTVEAVTLNKVSATMAETQLILTVYTLGDTIDEASRLAHRFATALCTVVWDKKPRGVQDTGAISIDLSPSASLSDGYENFIKGSRVSLTAYISAML